ncbi:TPA: hypothetical protein DCL30_04160 [Candidatus Peribacteria bacterium]|nr:MAG: hypothetical protein A3J91_04505 [Candidatus Peribacteria bacterium RIFOXYC2_FULL_58_10]OGJ83975.1 MAG: hypothetical protein A2529_04215 [Candidatus Peribacteria bacterium RIFOXYD2_FULL_58_15]HAI98699.1 hypothetical protein [Candidatus Peribacteria bacterium]HAS34412.1 hypothetical protein [Candidatus Peribacteria bacterium]
MQKRFTEDSWRREPWLKSLCAALLTLKTEEDVASFLRDIGTLSELKAWCERLEVARELAKGLSYRQVAANTGASTTTVTRVARFLENGEGGYRKVLNAHRHHRLVHSSESPHTTGTPGERTASVLQGYLEKAKK